MTLDILYKLLWSIPIAAFAFWFFFQIAKYITRKNFNNGICKCGGKFKLMHFVICTASDGSRGYQCQQCRKTIWVGYNVDAGYTYE